MNKLTAKDVMTRGVLMAHPDWSLDTLLSFFATHTISGAPVAGEDGVPVGVVSLGDVAKAGSIDRGSTRTSPYWRDDLDSYTPREDLLRIVADLESEVRVRDMMTPMVFSAGEDTTVQELAETMLTGRIHRVFIMRDKKIVGIVSSMDLLPIVRDS